MSQPQGNRRRRGRSNRGRGYNSRTNTRAAEYQARSQQLNQLNGFEDRASFWVRSNARLGIESANQNESSSRRCPVDFSCAICGADVFLERWPKDRRKVRCSQCENAVGGLISDEEKVYSDEYRKENRADRHRRYEGLPEMTEEDRAAIAEMRARSNLGNGRIGNRKRGSGGGGGKGQRRRKGRSNSNSNRNNKHKGRNNSGGGDGQRRRRRRRRPGDGGES